MEAGKARPKNRYALVSGMSAMENADPQARALALIELGQGGAPDALAECQKFRNDPDAFVALAAEYVCWMLGDRALNSARLLAALKSDDEALIQQAVETVTAMGAPLVPVLTPLLDAPAVDARLILNVLEEIGGPEAYAAVANAKLSDPSDQELAAEILDEWEMEE